MKTTKIYKYKKNNAGNSDREIIASVKQYLENQNAKFTVKRDEYGKPYISGIDGIHISVTHDKEICLVAVSDSQIGIDTERADRHVKNPRSLAARYFCSDEIAFLGENPTDEEFADMWVKKEALSKLIGKGIPCMKEKSIFSDDIVFQKLCICDEYITYCVRFKQ